MRLSKTFYAESSFSIKSLINRDAKLIPHDGPRIAQLGQEREARPASNHSPSCQLGDTLLRQSQHETPDHGEDASHILEFGLARN